MHMRALIRILTVLTLYKVHAGLPAYVTRTKHEIYILCILYNAHSTGRIYTEFLDEIQTKVL